MNRPSWGFIILITSLVIGSVPANAELNYHDRIVFERYTTNEGLLSDYVYVLAQDSTGFIWAGTDRGLTRFDGLSFLHFPPPDSLHVPFRSCPVEALHVLADGKMLVGTRDGLHTYDPVLEGMHRTEYLPTNADDPDARWVQSVIVDRKGRRWVGTRAGLFVFERAAETTAAFFRDEDSSFSGRQVQTVIEGRTGRIFLGTGAGLAIFDEAAQTFHRFTPPEISPGNPFYVNAIVESEDGVLYLSTSRGIESFDIKSGLFTVLVALPQMVYARSALTRDAEGSLWMATDTGLVRHSFRTGQTDIYRHDPSDPNSIGCDHVRSVMLDRTGLLWVGTEGSGIQKGVRPRLSVSVHRFPHKVFRSRMVTCFLETSGESRWIGTDSGLLFENRRDSDMEPTDSYREFLPGESILCLAEDGHGGLWCGTRSGKLVQLARDGHRVNDFSHMLLPSTPGIHPVTGIHRDADGVIWASTDDGLFLLNPEKKTVTVFRNDPNVNGSLGENSMNALTGSGPNRDVWIANQSKGLSRYDRNLNCFIHYRPRSMVKSAISHGHVHTVMVDSRGAIWSGTEDGLNRLLPDSEYFVKYGALRGKPVRSIVEDRSGNIWALHTIGLAKYDFRSETIRTYDALDGLPEDVQISALYRSRNGEVLMGCTGGYYAFDPRKERMNPVPPRITVTGVRGEKDPIKPETGLTGTGAAKLPRGENDLFFEVSVLDFTDQRHNQYRYRLAGYDPDWRTASWDARTVEYHNLPPGRYVIQVKGTNNDQVWSAEETRLSVVIRPHLYNTPLFRGILIMGCVSIFVFFFSSRYIRQRNERKRLFALIENLPGLVFLVERDGRVSFLNRLARDSIERIEPENLPSRTGSAINSAVEWNPGNNRIYHLFHYPFPSSDIQGSTLYLAIEVTEWKRTEQELTESRARYRRLAEHLQEVVENERKRISREIHDDLGQVLTMIRIETGWISKMASPDLVSIHEKNKSIGDLTQLAINSTRRICDELRPSLLDNLGLIPAIQSHVRSFQEKTGIPCETHLSPGQASFDDTVKTAIYRFVQECLTNVAKHANAGTVSVRLEEKPHVIEVSVKDDGVGIDPFHGIPANSYGILGMRERIEMLQGTLLISSARGTGTEVKATIPL